MIMFNLKFFKLRLNDFNHNFTQYIRIYYIISQFIYIIKSFKEIENFIRLYKAVGFLWLVKKLAHELNFPIFIFRI